MPYIIKTKLEHAGLAPRASETECRLIAASALAACILLGASLVTLRGSTTESALSLPLYIVSALSPSALAFLIFESACKFRSRSRKSKILKSLPQTIDAVTLCLEAGQSIDLSLLNVAQHLSDVFPEFSSELARALDEINSGRRRAECLKEMSDRIDILEVAFFVNILSDSSRLGTPISEHLQRLSQEIRIKQILKAEELAATIPTKMTLAAMILTVPPPIGAFGRAISFRNLPDAHQRRYLAGDLADYEDQQQPARFSRTWPVMLLT